jgi:hypothetical protein
MRELSELLVSARRAQRTIFGRALRSTLGTLTKRV